MFEDTYFQMFSSFVNLSESISIHRLDGSLLTGKEALRYVLNQIHAPCSDALIGVKSGGVDVFRDKYDYVFDRHEQKVSHYFRVLYSIVKFVDVSDVENKHFYVKLLRAQLSGAEADLLMLNYLSRHTTERFNHLVEKYGLLKNIDLDGRVYRALSHEIPPAALGRTRMEKL
ncbi:putative phage abortive infection protein [Yangia mangrovi]|nr:putative phage abortive infection protein [Alloyangia mangrovi]MCT4369097.1 putative phage abortive infection protein [Alloyangia mangrovi]